MKGLVGICQGEGLNFGFDGNFGGQGEKLFAVLAGEICHGAYYSLPPQDIIRKRWDVAHVDAAADDNSPFGSGGQGCRHEGADGGKNYGGIQGRRWPRRGVAGPDGTQRKGELLGSTV